MQRFHKAKGINAQRHSFVRIFTSKFDDVRMGQCSFRMRLPPCACVRAPVGLSDFGGHVACLGG